MICLTGLDKVRFLAPILIEDTIHLEAEIVEKLEMPEGTGLIITRIDVRNQRGDSVITGRIKMKAGRRPAPQAPIRRGDA
jgi:acyl dehydratase